MKYRALTSFSGVLSMCKDEERELENEALIKDLTAAGYIMPVIKVTKGKPATRSKGGKK